MRSDFERATRQGFGFALGAMIAVTIVVCTLILVMVLIGFAA